MRAGIALGSNVGDRLTHLRLARRSINELKEIAPPEKVSRIYETEPLPATPGAGRFLNAIIEIEYDGPPIMLLDAMQSIEMRMGRPSKRPRNAPRTIDLDILYVGNMVLNNDEVMIPHPRLHLRQFVLAPLAEIRPELVLPGQQASIAELLAKIRQPNVIRPFEEQWE